MDFEKLTLIAFVIALAFIVSKDIEFMTTNAEAAARANWRAGAGPVRRVEFSPDRAGR